MHPWQGRILHRGAESCRVPGSRGLCFCTAAGTDPGLIQPNTNWVKKGSLSWLCSPPTQPLTCTPACTHLPKPQGLGTGVGTDLPARDGAFLRRGCLAVSPSAQPLLCCVLSIFNAGRFFSSSTLGPSCVPAASCWPGQEVLVRDRTCARGHWEGQGTFGVTDSMAVLRGHHHRRMAQGWLCWDGSEPALALGCSPLLQGQPGVLWGFWRQWKIQTPFFGKAGSRGISGEALKGDADTQGCRCWT